jgi:hypothetical protein
MAAQRKTTLNMKPISKIFRFYGFYNNIGIGPNIRLNGVKIILHEVRANDIDEAFEFYKIHLVNSVGISEVNLEQYLIDLYYQSIKVEVLDGETVEHTEIPLITK